MKATILIGLPMSGKSTYAKQNNKDSVIIDCDYIRRMLSGEDDKFKAFNKDNEDLVWEIFYDMISDCKYRGKNIIIANTNCKLGILKVFLDTLKGWEIEFIIIDTPKSICVSRLPKDAQHMVEIIDKMEEEMIVTCDWLLSSDLNVKVIKGAI